MGTDLISAIASQSDSHRYEAVLRISEAIAACREPEELATTLASEIGKGSRVCCSRIIICWIASTWADVKLRYVAKEGLS